jgi:hypothetical protein
MASVTELGKRLATHQAHCAHDGLELQAIEDGVSYADIALGSLGSEAIAAGHMRKAGT